MDVEQFSRRLRRLLRERKMPVKTLASKVGVSRNTVYGWIKAKSLPQTYYLRDIRRTLECEWDELLGA